MKKIILFLMCVLLLCGCGKNNFKKIIEDLDERVQKASNYQIVATLEIYRNEDKFVYDVISTYKSKDFFKVELTNKTNQHNQIILRNEESVYVITPSLNKTFKFQSEWPYNNSQIYLLQPIILDAKNDSNMFIEKKDDGYVVISKVNYTSEKNFVKQRIYFDSEKNITKIEVIDNDDNIKMCFKIKSIQFNIELEKKYFDASNYEKNLDQTSNNRIDKSTSLETNQSDTVYPMYVPVDTYLSSQDIIDTENGERIISTFSGASEFIIVQEKLNNSEKTEYIYGDPYLILDTIGAISNQSISWISNEIEYSVLSNNLSIDELLMVAQSINVRAVGK